MFLAEFEITSFAGEQNVRQSEMGSSMVLVGYVWKKYFDTVYEASWEYLRFLKMLRE